MENKYCIFEIWDYKGGELTSYINLSRENFVSALADKLNNEIFELFDEGEEVDLEIIKVEVTKTIESPTFLGNYGGSNAVFCGELYEVVDNTLKEVKFIDFVDEISQLLFKWNVSDNL